MSTEQTLTPWFRSLYEAIVYDRYEGADVDLTALEAIELWDAKWGATARTWFHDLSRRPSNPVPQVSQEDLWELYAFSRVNQALLLAFQPHRTDDPDWAPDVTLDDYRAFVFRYGMDIVRAEPFTPFFHEIVSVEQHPYDDMPPAILIEHWPAVMLGNMLVSRAGVTISAGRNHIDKAIAETSTLYFEFRRRNRKVSDLSHGWGSNSQWRTDFRRDFLLDGCYHFHVDGEVTTSQLHPNDVSWMASGFETKPTLVTRDRDQRIELVTHRCLVVTTPADDDEWPYDDTFRTPVPEGLVITHDSGSRLWSVAISPVPVPDLSPSEIQSRAVSVSDPNENYRIGDLYLSSPNEAASPKPGSLLARLRSLWPRLLSKG